MHNKYSINKGINTPMQFKGLKAQYIWWLGGGLLCLLILFAILYIIGVNRIICFGIAGAAGAGLFIGTYRMSNTYGEHGLTKKIAKRSIPGTVKCHSRKLFMKRANQ